MRVVLYGEAHGDKDIHDNLVSNILPKVAERGVKDFAVEIPKSLQPSMDNFLKARDKGEVHPEKHFFKGLADDLNATFQKNNGIKGTVTADTVSAFDKTAKSGKMSPGLDVAYKAHSLGMKVHCVDSGLQEHLDSSKTLNNLMDAKSNGLITQEQYNAKSSSSLGKRNETMSKNIRGIQGKEVVGVFGAQHLEGENSLGAKLREKGVEVKSHIEMPTNAEPFVKSALANTYNYAKEFKASHPSQGKYQVPEIDTVPSSSPRPSHEHGVSNESLSRVHNLLKMTREGTTIPEKTSPLKRGVETSAHPSREKSHDRDM